MIVTSPPGSIPVPFKRRLSETDYAILSVIKNGDDPMLDDSLAFALETLGYGAKARAVISRRCRRMAKIGIIEPWGMQWRCVPGAGLHSDKTVAEIMDSLVCAKVGPGFYIIGQDEREIVEHYRRQKKGETCEIIGLVYGWRDRIHGKATLGESIADDVRFGYAPPAMVYFTEG